VRRRAAALRDGHDGVRFNPVTGDFSRAQPLLDRKWASSRFPVSEVTISLNLDKLLKRIDMVGSDLDWRISTVCRRSALVDDDRRNLIAQVRRSGARGSRARWGSETNAVASSSGASGATRAIETPFLVFTRETPTHSCRPPSRR